MCCCWYCWRGHWLWCQYAAVVIRVVCIDIVDVGVVGIGYVDAHVGRDDFISCAWC